MLGWAVTFFVIAIIAGLLGFGGIAASAASIAQILFVIFLILFLVSLVWHLAAGRRPPPVLQDFGPRRWLEPFRAIRV